eukprot:s1482_g3.t1
MHNFVVLERVQETPTPAHCCCGPRAAMFALGEKVAYQTSQGVTQQCVIWAIRLDQMVQIGNSMYDRPDANTWVPMSRLTRIPVHPLTRSNVQMFAGDDTPSIAPTFAPTVVGNSKAPSEATILPARRERSPRRESRCRVKVVTDDVESALGRAKLYGDILHHFRDGDTLKIRYKGTKSAQAAEKAWPEAAWDD